MRELKSHARNPTAKASSTQDAICDMPPWAANFIPAAYFRVSLNLNRPYYNSLGITLARVMTDTGLCYKAFTFRDACRDLGLKHITTKPYTSKTNGKSLPQRRPGLIAPSRPPCASGPMPSPTQRHSTAAMRYLLGCIA